VKKLAYTFIAALLFSPLWTFSPSAEISNEQFTHTVFAEEFTATWCVYCPSAAENLMKVYDDVPGEPYYDDNFFFVALITDVNDKANDRMGDFPDVTGYPTVIFDGNDEKVSGGQSDTSNYEQAIDTTGQREDTDISLGINMNHLGNDELDITVSMKWNEDGSFGDSTFNGYLRAYIVEKVSRYNNYDGDPYHFGFLDYAFDQSVELEPHEELSLTTIWKGGEHQDKNGNDFSDINYENINVFVAIFNDESTASDKYSLQSAFAIPPIIDVAEIENLVGGKIIIEGTLNSEKSDINQLDYRWNQGPWINTNIEDFSGPSFSFMLDTLEVANGINKLDIRAMNTGASNTVKFDINILNDFENPEIEILSHTDGETVDTVTVFEIEATDDNILSNVDFNVNDGDWRKMYSNQEDNFIASWNTQETNAGNGDHIIKFRAQDSSGNQVIKSLNLTVFNEGDVTFPSLKLISPQEEIYNARIEIEVETEDPDGIEKVEYKIDDRGWEELKNEGDNIFNDYWTPTTDGWHDLVIRSTDKQGYSTNYTSQFETDSTPPILNLQSDNGDISAIASFELSVDDYSKLDTLRYRIDNGQWIDLDKSESDLFFTWDSTDYEDGECLLEIECIDKWGSTNKIYKNLKVKNKGLINSVAPSNIYTENIVRINAVIDYENPKNVYLVVAKFEDDILSEGQKLTMEVEGNYHIRDLYFEEAGTYVYSIEIDTGHGTLKSYEQNIIVSEKQTEAVQVEEESTLPGLSMGPIIFIIIIIASRKR
tara:strand:+ start:2883 stop:5183 length:2301 start_codon:yes stop_codon:yes gene_type:complete